MVQRNLRTAKPHRERSTQPRRTPNRRLPVPNAVGFSPFHIAAQDYFDAGFLPIPLPIGAKHPPPKGTPNDLTVNEGQLQAWLADDRPKNIGTIVPDGVLVLDIDGQPGRESLLELENQLGALPETWMSFRGDPDHFHLWLRTPTGLNWPGKLGAGLDIIHRHYRYVVIPPSIHPNGSQYRWARL